MNILLVTKLVAARSKSFSTIPTLVRLYFEVNRVLVPLELVSRDGLEANVTGRNGTYTTCVEQDMLKIFN